MTTTQTDTRHCAHCGSALGLDCGEAEPDYDREHCSIGCYVQARVAITYQGPGHYYLESADGMASLDLDKITTEDGLRAAVVECIDVGTGAESWAGWKTTLASISLGSDGAAYAKALATAATPNDLNNYTTGEYLRPATAAEVAASHRAAALDGGVGAFGADDVQGATDLDPALTYYTTDNFSNDAPIASLPADFVAACRCNEGSETLEDWICEAANASAAAVAADGAVSVQSAASGQWSTLADVRQIMATINGQPCR